MSFCGPCEDIFIRQAVSLDKNFDHHRTWRSFLAAADQGCPVCWRKFDTLAPDRRALLRQLGAKWDQDLSIHSTRCATTVRFTMNSAGCLYMAFWSQSDAEYIPFPDGQECPDPRYFLGRHLRTLAFVPSEEGDGYVAPLQGTNSSSTSTWNNVQSWIGKCESDHKECAGRSDAGWYPTRLIDLGAQDQQSAISDMFRVVERGEMSSGEQYTTLSHRWDTMQTARLTVTTMPTYRSGVSISTLSRTFQDAIAVTRRLKLRYIWIDSLCIVQDGDDGRDWAIESTQMDKVYLNSFVNIAASVASGKEGLFFERDIAWSERLQLDLKIDRGDGRTTSGSFLHVPYHNWERIDMSPLSQRGWVLQEQLLSPRILHFDRREVFWECCQAVASENLPRGWPNIDADKMDKVAMIVARKRLNPLNDNLWAHANDNDAPVTGFAGEGLHYILWFGLVLKYSACQLSYESDRLVAISGVARYLKTINKDQYVAGLWRRHLEKELAWSTIRPLPADASYPYYAPSFSWTSVNGLVEPATHLTSGKPLVQVHPVHMPSASNPTAGPAQRDQPFQHDVFGPITGSTVQIKVTGQLKSMSMLTYGGSWYLLPSGSSRSPPPPNTITSTVENEAFEAELDHTVENAQVASFQAKTFYYVPWLVYETRNVIQCCLILEEHDRDMRQFRRIGICKPLPAHQHKSPLLLQEDPHRDLLPGYDKKTTLHTIYII